jgi:hypothetical protein
VWEVLYNVNGGSIDWHYGQQDVHWKIMAFTQEVGPSFWPPQSQIEALCQENLMPNLYSALIAEDFVPPPNYFTFVEKEVVDSTGNNNGVADPGEAVDLNVTIRNSGSATATGINSTLFTSDPLITITSANSAYPDLAVLATGENLTPFHFQVANNYPIGDTAMLKLRFTAAGGYDDTLTITLPIGDPLSQPSGPDAYGYLAYDQLDGHEMGDFEWVEIDPAYGGSGTSIPFTADDQTVQRPIPFTFTYYGQDYTQVSICTNGWVAMGYTTDTDHSNSQIPNPDGPPSMVAPFWEDLSPQASGAVLTYYDAVNQLFIVEFSRVRQYTPTTAFETFEAIFYNPAEYPTVTGDGLIKFQYLIVSDPTSCTVGIENQTETIGLQLLYNTSYNVNMRPIEDSSAAIFTTGEEIPGVTIALTPSSLPIIIPPQGGSFTYNLAIQNISTTQVFFDAWLEAMLPDSSIYEIMVRSNLSLGPGASISRNMTQNVPAVAPAGDYTYFGIVGNYPNAVYSQSSFPFSKSGADNSGMGNWNISGWEESGISAMMPTEYALGQNYPNPFNPETTIEFALPEASKVKLSVYNIKGELVEVLMEGNLETGYHTVNWNASAMPSGIYFYKLQADDFMSVKKCVLVK